ncbi:MAG: phosphopantetheine-binding protein [Roseitalea porphyridii]|nr:phosphopantetheine-binding protein [Roseitalea porphyridii]
MDDAKLGALRQTIGAMLVKRGMPAEFGDDDSLFDSGALDSMSAVNLLMELESVFGLDLSDPDFDISRIDTFAEITELVKQPA